MNQVTFTKMHGLGNDFIVIKGPLNLAPDKIRELCDRHMGIGADGLLVVSPTQDGVKMDYWNSDGSTAEMCGNGLRCVVRFAIDSKMVKPGKFLVQTAAGPLKVEWNGRDSRSIEVQVGKATTKGEPLTIQGEVFYEANVGNPHAVTFVTDTEEAPVTTLGPKIEKDPHFPNKTNVEFVQVIAENKLRLRVWERGVGETLACGTGMVATATVADKLDKIKLPVSVEVPGGSAMVWQDDEGYSRLRGPAEAVFEGIFKA